MNFIDFFFKIFQLNFINIVTIVGTDKMVKRFD